MGLWTEFFFIWTTSNLNHQLYESVCLLYLMNYQVSTCKNKRHVYFSILALINFNSNSSSPSPTTSIHLGKSTSINKEIMKVILINFTQVCISLHLNSTFNSKHFKFFMMFTVPLNKNNGWIIEFSNFKDRKWSRMPKSSSTAIVIKHGLGQQFVNGTDTSPFALGSELI